MYSSCAAEGESRGHCACRGFLGSNRPTKIRSLRITVGQISLKEAAYHRLQELLPKLRGLANPTREIPARELPINVAKILTGNTN
jgi:hypothetical protein